MSDNIIPFDKLPAEFSYMACNSSQSMNHLREHLWGLQPWLAISMVYRSQIASYDIKYRLLQEIAEASKDSDVMEDVSKLICAMRQRYAIFSNNDSREVIYRATNFDGSDIRDPTYSAEVDTLTSMISQISSNRSCLITRYLVRCRHHTKNDASVTGYAKFTGTRLMDVDLIECPENAIDSVVMPKINVFYPYPIKFDRGDIVRNTITNELGIVKTKQAAWRVRCDMAATGIENNQTVLNAYNSMINVYRINVKTMQAEIVKENPCELETVGPEDEEYMSLRTREMYKFLKAMKTIAGPKLRLKELTDAIYFRGRNFHLMEG